MPLRPDVTYALRVLIRTPAMTWPAVGSLALAIAVNATMFAVLNTVLLRPLGEEATAISSASAAPSATIRRSGPRRSTSTNTSVTTPRRFQA